MIRIITLVALIVFAAGCASYGKKIDPDFSSRIKKGSTTEAQVIRAIGSPMSVSIMPDGQKFAMYMYTYAQTKASTLIPIVGAFVGGVNSQTQSLQIWYDSEGIVTNYAYTDGNNELNTGILTRQ